MDTDRTRRRTHSRDPRRGRSAAAALLLGLGATLLAAGPATAYLFEVTDGGITAPSNNFGCDASAGDCSAERSFDLSLPGVAGGSVEIVGNTAAVTLHVLSVSFDDDDAGPGDVAGVVFSEVTYSGSANVISFGDPSLSFSAAYAGGGAAAVAGDFATLDASRGILDPTTPFSVDTSLLNLNCLVTGGTGQCSVQVGRTGFGLDVGGTPTDFVHTFNLLVVTIPEPSTGPLLVLGGMLGLTLHRLRRLRRS